MAYDEQLAARIRDLIGGEPGLTESRMFGGLAFLVDGHLAVGVSGQGGLMVRADPADTEAHLTSDGVEPMEMRGRPMKGWLRVAAEAVESEADLAAWVTVGVRFVRALPPKD